MSFPNTVLLAPAEEMRESSTQIAPLGTRGVTEDGRIFHYCKAGGTLVAGWPVISGVKGTTRVIENSPCSSNMQISTGTTIGTTWNVWPLQASQFWADTALTADTYKDGYICVGSTNPTKQTGAGRYYPIKSHTGATITSTAMLYVTLKDGYYPEVAMATDVGLAMVKNIYDDVEPLVQTAIPTANVIGIAPFAVTSGNFCWVQTWGPCCCAIGSATAINSPVICATDASVTGLAPGAVPGTTSAGVLVNQVIGTSLGVSVAGSYGFVNLQLNP